MPCPQAGEYNEAIQNLRSTVSDEELRDGEPMLNSLGFPAPYAGGFADVYKVFCPKTGHTWAVKCFTREVAGLRDRYREISAHLETLQLPFMVDFRYLEQGIRIGRVWHPILKMRWVEGKSLNEFVAKCLGAPATLRLLLQVWQALASRLRDAKVAHADLQHGNVLLVPSGDEGRLKVKLIDYDGMYVPALTGTRSGEVGHPSYQHPLRARNGTFNAEVDRFSHLTICCAIRALIAGQQPLWERFNNGENLLFREQDFRSPGNSEVFQELWALRDAEARSLVGHLILATQMPLERVPLLDEIVTEGAVRELSDAEQAQINRTMGLDKTSISAWPLAAEYNEAIRYLHCQVSDDELCGGRAGMKAFGAPTPLSGRFADVYRVHCPATGNTWAVKCFTQEIPDLRERYQAIAAGLTKASLPFTVDFQFVDPGIYVGGQWYPFLKMRWVDGVSLNQFVRDHLDRPETLARLLRSWETLAARLHQAQIAHGNLNHADVLLVSEADTGRLDLKLIDYDGMYVPSLAGVDAWEIGHPNYQHPQRLRQNAFGPEIDRFPLLVIYCAIRCLMAGGRALWERFDNWDNLLFCDEDFRAPGRSAVFRALWNLPDPAARSLAGTLALISQSPLDRVPALHRIVGNGKIRALSPTEEQAARGLIEGGKRRTAGIADRARQSGTGQPAGKDRAPSRRTAGGATRNASEAGAGLYCSAFWHFKRGSNSQEYSGAFAADPTAGRCALADGAERSAFAGIWAQLLVHQYVEAVDDDPQDWSNWLPAAQQEWSEQTRNLELPWSGEAPSVQGATAHFLGTLVAPKGRSHYDWKAMALGSICLFHTRGDRLLASFPIERSREFGARRWLVGSLLPPDASDLRQTVRREGEAAAGDQLWMISGPLAPWFLAECECGNQPWTEMLWLLQSQTSRQDFASWIEELRDAGRLRNDDVTLAAVQL